MQLMIIHLWQDVSMVLVNLIRRNWSLKFDAYGTIACLEMLNDAVKKGGIMAYNRVGVLSGAFISVSENQGIIRALSKGRLNLEKLEAMNCVCSVGLDMNTIPGEINHEVISGIIADEGAIGMVNLKTTAVSVIPAIGYKPGDRLEFGALLGSASVLNINQTSNSIFINRGGLSIILSTLKIII